MGIHVSAYEMVKSGECINCIQCIDICPAQALSSNAQPIVAGTIATVGIAGLYYAGTILPTQIAPVNSVVEVQSNAQSGAYLDGTYTGTGEGFRGEITVEVTVVEGAIQDITVISQQEDAQFFNRAESVVIEEILSSQSVDVTPVSGATFSSNGIIEAVSNALNLEFENPNTTNAQRGHGGGPNKRHPSH